MNIDHRKLVANIMKASLKIATEHRRGPANFVRIPHNMLEKFPTREITGINIHEDIDLVGEIIVGRIDNDFIAEEKITI
jgi:hypothetical protein